MNVKQGSVLYLICALVFVGCNSLELGDGADSRNLPKDVDIDDIEAYSAPEIIQTYAKNPVRFESMRGDLVVITGRVHSIKSGNPRLATHNSEFLMPLASLEERTILVLRDLPREGVIEQEVGSYIAPVICEIGKAQERNLKSLDGTLTIQAIDLLMNNCLFRDQLEETPTP